MLENQNVEWKESWRDEYLKWICAFANSQGGTLVIGKRDDGSIKGIDNVNNLLESLPNKILQKLNLICNVNLRTEGNLEYLEIQVPSSLSAIAFNGRYFKRTGSTTQLLTGQILVDFLREKSNLQWDEVIVDGVTIDDIDQEAIDKFKEKAKKSGRVPSVDENTSTADVLENLDLISKDGSIKKAGVILFAKRPSKFIREAILKIGRFGESPSDLRSQELLEGNNFQMADKVIELLDNKYIIRNISYDGLTRLETPEYPFEAIREAIFNAIVHRAYESASITIRIFDDRLEVWNDGLLNERLNIEDLKTIHNSYPRNKLMANVFYKAGFIESWGRGTIKIHEECERYGLPEPKIHEYSGGVAVTLFKAKKNQLENSQLGKKQSETSVEVSNDRKKVINYISMNGAITTENYSSLMGVTNRTARRHLNELIELGVVEKIGENRSTKYILTTK